MIQILFGWEGDHLHAFRVGKKTYSDPSWDLDDADDEDGAESYDKDEVNEQLARFGSADSR